MFDNQLIGVMMFSAGVNRMHKTKPDVLYLLHLPPAVHGSAIVGLSIKESFRINEAFDGRYLNLLLSGSAKESGVLAFHKAIECLGLWFRLLFLLIMRRPAVCYFALTSAGGAFFRDVMLVFLLKVFRVKRVFHLHNKGFGLKSGNVFYRFFYRFVFNDSEVILLSMLLYPDISCYVPEGHVRICPNGISDPVVGYVEKSNSIPEVLFLSNLIEEKGIRVLLEACSLLKERGCMFHCSLVGGPGNMTAWQVEQLIGQMKLEDYVRFLGARYGKEKERVYNEADIFAFPTYYRFETFGLVNLEAMQFRLPVVSTFEGGIPDVVDDGVTGFLVPQKDALALADKLELLIRDKKLRETMGEAGYLRYRDKFTRSHFESCLIGILQKSIQSG